MSGFRTPEVPREQLVLWEHRLEDALPADHQVRHLDVLLGSEAFAATFREMEGAYVLNRGQPPYHPRDLAGLYLYGMLHRIRSSRQLEAACYSRLDVIWLMQGQSPDHSTIADFVGRHGKTLRKFFKDTLEVLIGAELVKEIGARLCLTELQTSHLAFLVEHHLLLPKVSQRRDLTDEETIASVARMVRTRQALDDLALLAVADMKAVGPKNFTPWKAHLLAELYHRVRHALETGGSAWRTAAARGEVQASVSSLLAQVDLAGLVVDAARVERFVASMPLRYLLATPPDALLRHLLASVRGEGDAVHVEFHTAATAPWNCCQRIWMAATTAITLVWIAFTTIITDMDIACQSMVMNILNCRQRISIAMRTIEMV